MTVRCSVPWWLRIGSRLVLARMPLSFGFWRQFRLFEHGDIDEWQRAFHTLVAHSRTAGVLSDGHLSRFDARPDSGFSWLKHLLVDEFVRRLRELARIVRPAGVWVLRVDLKDHLRGGMNNLRYSNETWEGALSHWSGFYTNRIRFHAMLSMFDAAGFEARLPRVLRWERLPIARSVLAELFRCLADDGLLVSGYDVALRPDA